MASVLGIINMALGRYSSAGAIMGVIYMASIFGNHKCGFGYVLLMLVYLDP